MYCANIADGLSKRFNKESVAFNKESVARCMGENGQQDECREDLVLGKAQAVVANYADYRTSRSIVVVYARSSGVSSSNH